MPTSGSMEMSCPTIPVATGEPPPPWQLAQDRSLPTYCGIFSAVLARRARPSRMSFRRWGLEGRVESARGLGANRKRSPTSGDRNDMSEPARRLLSCRRADSDQSAGNGVFWGAERRHPSFRKKTTARRKKDRPKRRAELRIASYKCRSSSGVW